MTKQTLSVQAPDGSTVTRTTARTYTHAVLVGPSEGKDNWGAWAWCGRHDLAVKELAKAQAAWAGQAEVVLVEVPSTSQEPELTDLQKHLVDSREPGVTREQALRHPSSVHTEAFKALQARKDGAKTLDRAEATRVSIGRLQVGQDVYQLRSGRLVFQGTVVAEPIKQGGSAGFTVELLSPHGNTLKTWGGSATQFYTPTNGPEAQEGDAKAMASTDTTSTTPEATEPQVNLHQELVSQLKEAGIKVTPKWSPTKKYAAYKQADGKTLAYVFAQTSSGIKVKAGLEMKELDRAAKKSWLDNSKEAPFSIRGFFTLDNLGQAVEAIKATAEKLAQAKAAKAEAKKPAAKKTTKKAPAQEPSITLVSPAEGLVKVGDTTLGEVQA